MRGSFPVTSPNPSKDHQSHIRSIPTCLHMLRAEPLLGKVLPGGSCELLAEPLELPKRLALLSCSFSKRTAASSFSIAASSRLDFLASDSIAFVKVSTFFANISTASSLSFRL
uniref:Uncharacterized protein n=1 Tax=Zea mays TaxID=4577 RepID=C4J1F0_MAIZE|nr:unknown [Zea mays]